MRRDSRRFGCPISGAILRRRDPCTTAGFFDEPTTEPAERTASNPSLSPQSCACAPFAIPASWCVHALRMPPQAARLVPEQAHDRCPGGAQPSSRRSSTLRWASRAPHDHLLGASEGVLPPPSLDSDAKSPHRRLARLSTWRPFASQARRRAPRAPSTATARRPRCLGSPPSRSAPPTTSSLPATGRLARLARALPGQVGRVRAYGVTGSHRRPRGGFGRCRPGRAVVPGRAGADRRAGFAS